MSEHSKDQPYIALTDSSARKFIAIDEDVEYGFTRFKEEAYLKPIEQVEADMVGDTDELIGILDGSITEDSKHFLEGKRRYDGPVEGVIWLDKSARPVRALAKELWTYMSDSQMPPASFLNIDKEDYLFAMGYSPEDFKNKYIDPAELSADKLSPRFLALQTARIRSLYLLDTEETVEAEKLIDSVENKELPLEALQELWSKETSLDGKHIGIVDEVSSSRATLTVADLLMSHAFSSTRFEAAFWSVPKTMLYHQYDSSRDEVITKLADSEKPQWYESNVSSGRGGIENKNPEFSSKSKNIRQRLGKSVLSISYSRYNGRPDQKGIEYRKDFKTLKQRFVKGKIAYRPAPSRDDFEKRIEAYYKMPFAQWRKERPTSRPGVNHAA